MNEFSSTENSGLLKDNYDDSTSEYLKKKRKKLYETKTGKEEKEEGE